MNKMMAIAWFSVADLRLDCVGTKAALDNLKIFLDHHSQSGVVGVTQDGLVNRIKMHNIYVSIADFGAQHRKKYQKLRTALEGYLITPNTFMAAVHVAEPMTLAGALGVPIEVIVESAKQTRWYKEGWRSEELNECLAHLEADAAGQ